MVVIGDEKNIKIIKEKIRQRIVLKKDRTSRKYLYSSYWKGIVNKNSDSTVTENMFFSSVPNVGAGIGHQLANWIAGYWFAKQFKLKFAHIPFSNSTWEEFFGFYQNEVLFSELVKKGYKVVRIPIFDEHNENEIEMIRNIISAYSGKKIVFLTEQDQFYQEQYGVIQDIQKKFYSCKARKNESLIYNKDTFNLAVHVRRGDIVQTPGENNEELSKRFQSNDYFVSALETALDTLKDKKNIHIYLFSQGKKEDYSEFLKFNNLHFCLDMGAKESFLHMVYADALITSKSSFSYKPALLNRGIKFVPKDFWHGYPQNSDWIQLEEDGTIKNNAF